MSVAHCISMSIKRLRSRIKIGISSCLLGQAVRYDGGHKRNGFLINKLGRYFELVPICPEVGIGMPIPRPPIHLVKHGEEIRVLDARTHSRDYTGALYAYPDLIHKKIESLSGYILKKKSPSCGIESAEIFAEENPELPLPQKSSGMFVQSLQERFPLLPMEDEKRLCDPLERENFIQQVLVYQRWRCMSENTMKQQYLLSFHKEHQNLIMAHNPDMDRKLRHMIARAGCMSLESVKLEYITTLMRLLGKRVAIRRPVNAA